MGVEKDLRSRLAPRGNRELSSYVIVFIDEDPGVE